MDIRVAAYAVIIEDDQVLLSHWNENGRSGWSMPGGGIDPGEDPAEAAVREIFEETGYHAVLDELLGIDSHVVPAEQRTRANAGPLHAIRIVYRAHVIGGELTNEVDGSSDEAKWVPLAEVPQLRRVGLVDIALGMNLRAD
ncbi:MULTISPECIES: NUDIX hydrolase [unclassified Diaminobutyricimonas]|uniref:NUDIX hydrolase n=1 Tax=unclassified Diaminobutyricimonas TaxID=2643261 RepID=UPI0012F4E6C9|nr:MULTISPECIES: NUDIX hydrolase [unclassified Diaminobutyricimonas]